MYGNPSTPPILAATGAGLVLGFSPTVLVVLCAVAITVGGLLLLRSRRLAR